MGAAWLEAPPLDRRRCAICCATLNGSVYVAGGHDGNGDSLSLSPHPTPPPPSHT